MDGDASTLLGAIILAFLLIVNFIMTAFASAINSISDSELEEAFESEGKPPDEIRELKSHPGRLMPPIWFLTALTYTGAGFLMTQMTRNYPAWAVFAVLAVIFYLFGNSIPEMLGHKNASRWLLKRFGVVRGVMTVTIPFTYVMTGLSNLCIRLLGIDPKSLESEVTEDEIISMVNEGHEQGVLDAREAEMIQNIFEMDDKNASDIMIHRKNIIGIDGEQNLAAAISFMVEQSVSRFPVYVENIDNIIGILHFKDAMKFHTLGNYDNWLVKDIPGLLREAKFIPETRGIDRLFRSMQSEKIQMVMVADEYGQTAGLVTMEDILEEIVGNIQDEYDADEEFIRRDGDGDFLMDGMTPLSDVQEALGVEFEGEEYDTLNGLLISMLDRIPADGERAELVEMGYRFQIIEVENKMIRLVKITKITEEEQQEKE